MLEGREEEERGGRHRSRGPDWRLIQKADLSLILLTELTTR